MTLAEKLLRNATSATAVFILKKALQKHLFADSADDRLKLTDKVVYLDFVVEIIPSIRRPEGAPGLASR